MSLIFIRVLFKNLGDCIANVRWQLAVLRQLSKSQPISILQLSLTPLFGGFCIR